MSKYELIDYDRLLNRIGIPNQQDWRCGANEPDVWSYDQENLTYDDLYDSPDPELGQPFGAKYDGRALRMGTGGLCLTSDINVNGLLLNNRDANGTIWLCSDIEGWWTLPPAEIPDVPKPYWDGSMLTTGRYLTRTITVTGSFIPPNKSLVWYNRDLLIRVSSIVRGVGLLATCGNATTSGIDFNDPEYFDPFYDPPKMAIIQTNDVPLIETVRGNGITQFSLSFKCVQPTKQSVGERNQTIPFTAPVDPDDPDSPDKPTRIVYRRYKAFSSPTALPDETSGAGEPEGTGVTVFAELKATEKGPSTRAFSDVQLYNVTNQIEDEDYITAPPEDATVTTAPLKDQTDLLLNNKGNYFAFPVFVFDPMTFDSTAPGQRYLQISNLTTGESLKIIKPIVKPDGWSAAQLVVDTGARRVALVDPALDSSSWIWNARDYLSLDSSWVTLAPGMNQMVVSGRVKFITGNQPRAFWRDSWIG